MSEKEQQTTAAAQSTTTKDNTTARLKIEQEYNDKRTGWQRYYKVTTTTPSSIHCTCISRRRTATVDAKAKSEHSHTCSGNNTLSNSHTQVEIQTHRHFYSFLIRFPRKCDECAKGFCRCRCLKHTHTYSPNLHIHRQTGMHTYVHECLCVCVEPPLAVSPTALLFLLLLPSLLCERASVFVDFGVYVGQQQQQQPNSGPWLRVYGARAAFGRNSLKHTYMYICSQAYSLIPTHTCIQTLSAHLLHFACALSRLLLLDAAVTAFCCCYCHFFALRSFSLQFAQIRISVAIFFCTSFCTCKLRERCV